MKVYELIEILKTHDQESEIYTAYDSACVISRIKPFQIVTCSDTEENPRWMTKGVWICSMGEDDIEYLREQGRID